MIPVNANNYKDKFSIKEQLNLQKRHNLKMTTRTSLNERLANHAPKKNRKEVNKL